VTVFRQAGYAVACLVSVPNAGPLSVASSCVARFCTHGCMLDACMLRQQS